MNIDENVQKNECSCNTENGQYSAMKYHEVRKQFFFSPSPTSLSFSYHFLYCNYTHSFERLLDFLNADRDYTMDVEIDDVSCETDDYFCITLYRVVQECLLNIKKHSQATRVLFHCKKTEQKYEILIQDNGKGFTMEEAEDKANSHFGLALIHEDVNLLNGTIHVSSAIGRGTTIDIKIPLDLHSALKKNS